MDVKQIPCTTSCIFDVGIFFSANHTKQESVDGIGWRQNLLHFPVHCDHLLQNNLLLGNPERGLCRNKTRIWLIHKLHSRIIYILASDFVYLIIKIDDHYWQEKICFISFGRSNISLHLNEIIELIASNIRPTKLLFSLSFAG